MAAEIKKLKSDDAYQLKITLNDVYPDIWRRFVVEADIKLPDLHKVIQTVMGWDNAHLHIFRIDKKLYSLPDEEFDGPYVDYRKIRLNQVVTAEKQKFFYDYDFSDGWEHTIVLEKILPKDEGAHYPLCVDGERNCPPDDCGGPYGYMGLQKTIADPRHEEYEEMMEWLGGDFDPEEFYLDDINEMLQEKDYGCIDLFD